MTILLYSGERDLLNNPSDSVITVRMKTENNGVCIECFIDSSTNGSCLLVIHPKPSLLHTHQGLSNIDVVHLNRSGDIANGCISGINHTSHYIAAFLYDETQAIQGPVFVVKPQSKAL